MLKQTIDYEDIDEQPAQATLWFNLTNLELSKDIELEVLEARFKKFQDEVFDDGKARQLTPAEIREMYRMLEVLVKASYGKRYGENNKYFSKAPEVWQEFNDSGQYDGFMRWLFGDQGVRANAFFENIWPRELREAHQDEQRRQNVRPVPDAPVFPDNPMADVPNDPFLNAPDDGVPSITELVEERRLGQYPDSEILAMSDDEFDALVNRFKSGNNVPGRLLVLGFQRNKERTTE